MSFADDPPRFFSVRAPDPFRSPSCALRAPARHRRVQCALSHGWALKNVFAFLKSYLIVRVEQGVTRDLRNQVYDHLLSLDLAFFGRTRTGQIISRLTHDVEWQDKSQLDIGDEIDVWLESVESDSGLVQLSKRKADRMLSWQRIVATTNEGDEVTGRVMRKIKGGLLVDIGTHVALLIVGTAVGGLGDEFLPLRSVPYVPGDQL